MNMRWEDHIADEELFSSRLKSFTKKHMNEFKYMNERMEKISLALNSGANPDVMVKTTKWIHPEPDDIKAVGPSSKGMAVSRLYFYLDKPRNRITLLTLGTKKNKGEESRIIKEAQSVLESYLAKQGDRHENTG